MGMPMQGGMPGYGMPGYAQPPMQPMMGGAGPSGGGGMPQMMVSVPAGVGPGQPFQVNANGQASSSSPVVRWVSK